MLEGAEFNGKFQSVVRKLRWLEARISSQVIDGDGAASDDCEGDFKIARENVRRRLGVDLSGRASPASVAHCSRIGNGAPGMISLGIALGIVVCGVVFGFWRYRASPVLPEEPPVSGFNSWFLSTHPCKLFRSHTHK